MTQNNNDRVPMDTKQPKRRRCRTAVGAVIIFLILAFIIALILSLTVFKLKKPRIKLLSASVEGVAPRVSFPTVQFELNLTVGLKLLVQNRNHASFKHDLGKSLLFYQGHQVGEADIDPGLIPARGSATIACRLTLEVDELASNLTSLISDALSGDLAMETRARIPGRISFFGIFTKHAVAILDCQLTIAVLHMNITGQTCKEKTKL